MKSRDRKLSTVRTGTVKLPWSLYCIFKVYSPYALKYYSIQNIVRRREDNYAAFAGIQPKLLSDVFYAEMCKYLPARINILRVCRAVLHRACTCTDAEGFGQRFLPEAHQRLHPASCWHQEYFLQSGRGSAAAWYTINTHHLCLWAIKNQ